MLLKYERAGVVRNAGAKHARAKKWVLVENWRSVYVPLLKMPLGAPRLIA
jgi:hypothetical protein